MNIKNYLRDRLFSIAMLAFGIASSEILLLPSGLNPLVRIYIAVCPAALFFLCAFAEYHRKKSYYDAVRECMDGLDAKYLIAEIMRNPDFTEGKILRETLREAGKSMLENVNRYKYLQEDYKEYIELWIHEVKLPIATGKMMIENNRNDVTASINEELDKIENYIEQALFYARSQTPEKDYLVKKQNLKGIVNRAVLKNKRSLIQNNVRLNIHGVEKWVYTDSKWCVFILNQILQNSVKYGKKENGEIEIYAEEKKDGVILHIRDNGIGIRESEVGRVFEKGFTGENGRKGGQKATGIGLYLCKKLCDKLGLAIGLNSGENVGTEVKIAFPKSSLLEETVGNRFLTKM